jgi:hypothetical protein
LKKKNRKLASVPCLTLSPAGLGQLAQHFFKAKLLQKLLSVKNSEN